MNELLQKHGCSNVFTVPEGLKELMADITREVLRDQPPKLFDYIANYLSVLLITREHGLMAVKILDDLCDCKPSVSEHLMQHGMQRTEADTLAKIIKEEIEGTEPTEGKEKVKEAHILKKILTKTVLDEEMAAKVCQVARNAYRDYWYRKKLLEKNLKVHQHETWEIAAERTLELYKKTKPSFGELQRATERIQAAYRGYHVRRHLLRHLKPKTKKKGAKVEIPGPPIDVAGSREIDLGPMIDLKVREVDTTAMFNEAVGEKLGLQYDPMKTIKHVEGPEFEKLKTMKSEQPKSMKFDDTTPLEFEGPKSMKFDEPKSMKFDEPKSMKFDEPKSMKFEDPKSMKFDEPKSMKFETPKSMKVEERTSMKFEEPRSMKFDEQTSMVFEEPRSMKLEEPRSMRFDVPTSMKFEEPKSMKSEEKIMKSVESKQTKSRFGESSQDNVYMVEEAKAERRRSSDAQRPMRFGSKHSSADEGTTRKTSFSEKPITSEKSVPFEKPAEIPEEIIVADSENVEEVPEMTQDTQPAEAEDDEAQEVPEDFPVTVELTVIGSSAHENSDESDSTTLCSYNSSCSLCWRIKSLMASNS